MAAVIESQYATKHELETVYGLEGMYDLFEVCAVAGYNEYQASKHAAKGV
jgi:hypothetical protein